MYKFLLAFVILSVFYLCGPKPDTPHYDPVLPELPDTGSSLETYIESIEQRHEIKPGNKARIVWHNDSLPGQKTPISILYLHGFSASHQEGFPTHLRLAEKYGCNLYLARISDHGIDTADALFHFSAERAWKSAKEAYAIAKKLGDEVVIMSTSTGGTLALKLAAAYPEIKGLINLSPNIAINDPFAFLLNNPWGLQIARIAMGGNFRTVESDETYRKYWYHTYRIEALTQLQELIESICTVKTFNSVKCPVFNAFYYKDKLNQDPVVRVDAIWKMHNNLGTPHHQRVALSLPEANTHIIGSNLKSSALPELHIAMDAFVEKHLGFRENHH